MRTTRSDARLIVAIAVTAACWACGEPPVAESAREAPGGTGRVLVVGIDGAAPQFVDAMLTAGELPNLARIARAGARGTIRSLLPIESPPIWNSVVTGKLPAQHGILGFARETEAGDRHLYLGSDRRVHAVWNIVSDAGRTAGVVNFWNTYPPELIDGVMISDHVMPRNVAARREMSGAGTVTAGPTVHPEAWRDRVGAILGERAGPTAFENPLIGDPDLPGWLGLVGDDLPRRFDEDGALARIALEIESTLRPDLLMVLLPGVDRASHFLWGSLVDDQAIYPEELRQTDRQRAAGRRALETYYRYVDALLGLLVDRYGDEDLILVLSDHGFEPGRGLGILTGVHAGESAIDGIAFARGPGIRPGTPIEDFSVVDVTPTILAWMGLPVGADMKGRVADFMTAGEVAVIESHDRGPVARMALRPSGAEGEIVEQLERLGYVE